MIKLSEIIATYFYIGHIKKAPGTWATLMTVPLWFLLSKINILAYMFVCLVLVILGALVAEIYQNKRNQHDSQEIVIDEVVGFLITMTWLPLTWQAALGGVVLFRFFDILKPGPIRILDQRVKGGLGVMVDDVAAGLISNLLLQIVLTKTSWLGAQIIY